MDIIELINSKDNLIALSPLSMNEIKESEKILELKFNEEYKKYVSTFGAVVYDGHEITGVCKVTRLNVINTTKDERKYNKFVPKDWYVIESLGIDGIVIWQNEIGEIYQTIPNGSIKKIYDSLYEYIKES